MAMTEERQQPTDPTDPGESATASGSGGAAPSRAELDRRNFFRVFSREAVQTAATVVGAASAVRKGTTAAAVELLGIGIDPAAGADRLLAAVAPIPAPPGSIGGRSPYRLDGERMLILDQRRLPGEMVDAICSSGGEVAGLIREGAIGPGPVLGPVAAYALVMAAERNVASRPFVRSATLRGTANALRNARPDSAALDVAVTRMVETWERIRRERVEGDPAEVETGAAIAVALRAEADVIAMETMTGLGRLVERATSVLPQPADRPLEAVTIGATGPLSAGVIGTAAGVLAAVAAAGRPVHAWVLETRPGRSGARIGAAELQASDVPATVVADGAIGWLFRERTIDAVLVSADRIAANGDIANATGTYPLAAIAARHGVPVFVCALRATIDTSKASGAELSIIMRGRQDLLSPAGEPTVEGVDARVPLSDITPAELIAGYVTEDGRLQAPFVVDPGDLVLEAASGAASDPALGPD